MFRYTLHYKNYFYIFSSSSGSWPYYDDVIGTIEDKSVASVRYNKAVLTFTHCLKSYFSPISDWILVLTGQNHSLTEWCIYVSCLGYLCEFVNFFITNLFFVAGCLIRMEATQECTAAQIMCSLRKDGKLLTMKFTNALWPSFRLYSPGLKNSPLNGGLFRREWKMLRAWSVLHWSGSNFVSLE